MNGYRTHVFDMDGVLLDSNGIKSRAFYESVVEDYGADAAERMVAFHQTAGSLSRLERYQHFFANILEREPAEGEIEAVMARCAEALATRMSEAATVPGVVEYLRTLSDAEAIVVTGVLTAEAVAIIEDHGLRPLVQAIYGGPRHKGEVLKRLVNGGVIALPAVYYGDTEDDYRAATAVGLDFIFVSGCSEWADGRRFFKRHMLPVKTIENFVELLPAGHGVKVRVDRDGYADVFGVRTFISRSLAGAEVTL